MKKISYISVYFAAIMFLFSTSPLLVEAKQNSKGKSEEKKERKIEKEDKDERKDNSNSNSKNCLRAFGHLFAKGWLKRYYSPSIDEFCYLPFGINKKFGGNASSTPDTVAPVINNIDSIANMGKAIVAWSTDEKSDSYVFYSTTNPVDTNASSTPVFGNNTKTKNHWVVLNNLSAGTTYYFIVRSKDASGNTSFGIQSSFTTHSPSPVGDTNAPVITNIVGVVSTTSIDIGWKTNEFATSKVYYSQNTPVNLGASNFVQNLALDNSHLITIPSLLSGTKYYFVIESKDSANNIAKSLEFNFTTQGASTTPDTTAPNISSIVTSVSSSTINVSWVTNEPATSKVFYIAGSSVDANSTTTPFVSDNNLVLNHNLSIPNLATSTLYSMITESKDDLNNRGLSGLFSTTTLAN